MEHNVKGVHKKWSADLMMSHAPNLHKVNRLIFVFRRLDIYDHQMKQKEEEGRYESAAYRFLELASNQRLEILFQLLEENSKITQLANKIGVTKQEVFRNFTRLIDSGLIDKNTDGSYQLTTFGRAMCTQIPTLMFLADNRKYFEEHYFGDVPSKFVMRIGQLDGAQYIKGVTRVLEQIKSIYNNAEEHIYEVLGELSLDRLTTVAARTKANVKLSYVASEKSVVPKGRKQLIEKLGFSKLIEKGFIERRMKKNVQTMVILSEKEACVLFPRLDGEADLTEAFYCDKESFREWCLDYFTYCWHNSDVWQESKLKE